jgi:hypothetical protein
MSMNAAKLVLPRIVYDGQKRNFPSFERLVFQSAMAFKFDFFLREEKDAAITALAMQLTPRAGVDEVKVPSDETLAKASAWYEPASPIVAGWLEAAVPQSYRSLTLRAPMGDAFATWNVLKGEGCTSTKAEARHYKKCFHGLRMQVGVSYEDFVSEITLHSSLIRGRGSAVSEESKLEVLLEGVTAPYFMAKAILESREETTFDHAVAAFAAVSSEITRRRAHEKAHNVHTAGPFKKNSQGGRRQTTDDLKVFCPIHFSEKKEKWPHRG